MQSLNTGKTNRHSWDYCRRLSFLAAGYSFPKYCSPGRLRPDGFVNPRGCPSCLSVSLLFAGCFAVKSCRLAIAMSNKSLDASGGGAFRNLIRPAVLDSNRAAASTLTLYCFLCAVSFLLTRRWIGFTYSTWITTRTKLMTWFLLYYT